MWRSDRSWFLNTIYYGEKLWLPMIDVKLTKENALPYDLWGLLARLGTRRHRTA